MIANKGQLNVTHSTHISLALVRFMSLPDLTKRPSIGGGANSPIQPVGMNSVNVGRQRSSRTYLSLSFSFPASPSLIPARFPLIFHSYYCDVSEWFIAFHKRASSSASCSPCFMSCMYLLFYLLCAIYVSSVCNFSCCALITYIL